MDKPKLFSTVESKRLHENPYWAYDLDRYIMPNGKEANYYYVNSRGSVMIIPRFDDDTFLLTKQYRYLNQKVSIEFPGGGCKVGKDAEVNAIEELAEEVGYKANAMSLLSRHNPCNGMTNELCSVYLAEDLQPFSLTGDESEAIEIVKLSYDELNQAVQDGSIWDGMTLAAWSLYNIIVRNRNK